MRNAVGAVAGWVFAAAVTAAGTGSVSGAEAASQWSGWDPGTVIEFNALRGRITEPLPFDVPFYLLTPPPQPLAQDAEPVALVAAHARSEPTCKPSAVPTMGCRPYPTSLCEVPVTEVQELIQKKGDPKPQLEISMPQLDPNKDYCLVLISPREPNASERDRMVQAAGSVIREALASAGNPDQVLTGSMLQRLCLDVRTRIEAVISETPETVAVPKKTSPLSHCSDAALPAAIHAAAVSAAGLSNLEVSIAEAETALASIRAGVDPTEKTPLLEEIQPLVTREERLEYLGLPSQLPLEVGKPDIDAWSAAVGGLQARLSKGWTPTAAEKATCNDAAASRIASPLLRLRCLGVSELAGVQDALEDLRAVLPSANAARDQLIAAAAHALAGQVAIGATTSASFEDRFRWHVSADLGIARAWDLSETFAYAGANIYISPVNKKAPLNGYGVRLGFRRRFAFVIGLPSKNIDDPRLKPIVGGRHVLLGAGLRLTDHLRVTAGGLIFNEEDPDPLVDDTKGLAATPFAALSLDVNVAKIFADLFK